MSEMPERIWAGFDYPVGYGSESFDSKLSMWDIGSYFEGSAEYIRADIVEAKDAEIVRLKTKLAEILQENAEKNKRER